MPGSLKYSCQANQSETSLHFHCLCQAPMRGCKGCQPQALQVLLKVKQPCALNLLTFGSRDSLRYLWHHVVLNSDLSSKKRWNAASSFFCFLAHVNTLVSHLLPPPLPPARPPPRELLGWQTKTHNGRGIRKRGFTLWVFPQSECSDCFMHPIFGSSSCQWKRG